MEFSQLRHFLAVARTLHFGRAAEELGMTQPHLSRAIARLEAELGILLFLRTSRKVQLTAAGEVFQSEALELVRGQQRAMLLARAASTQGNQVLRIGFVSAALYHLLPAMLRELRAMQPGVRTELREASTQEQLNLLAGGDIDIGLGHPPVECSGRIVNEVLLSDHFDALLPADHDLAHWSSVSFTQLAAYPFVLFPEEQGPVLYAAIRDQCRLAGHPLVTSQTATRLHSQCSLIAAGLGVGLAPVQSRSLQVEGAVRVPIKPYPATLQLPLAVFRDERRHSSLHENCLRILRRLSRSHADALAT
ncbi:LysR substrate-binding domain-containing protein [Brenneria tiliae]|uniref:LysR substrate-binding domain-containing protein n=1 Tax=Brenneria tiliae TaxID=2914984 RepID=UPI0020148DAA|nr:LysR substrate-binding domain-containing protein [Brenneria tiliae]MCL2900326.1 LysR substrate-binding domain-containing protein [Brenneria tiliae]MCL2904187.1 LysR substrate-binding domain-containing protein [Brenneria tiliae]